MTRAIPFTKASLKRAIAAAREAGLTVTGLKPDGTLIFGETESHGIAADALDDRDETPTIWGKVRA